MTQKQLLGIWSILFDMKDKENYIKIVTYFECNTDATRPRWNTINISKKTKHQGAASKSLTKNQTRLIKKFVNF